MKKCGITFVEFLLVLAVVGILIFIHTPYFREVCTQQASYEAREARPRPRPKLTPAQECEQAMRRPIEIKSNISGIKNFGNDCVYYFPFTREEYAKNISIFLNAHPNLEVATSDSDVLLLIRHGLPEGDYFVTVGRTVFFREKR